MTVINHKNISGITSITTPAGSDNLFTVHTNDTTERFRIDASGHQNISGIITASNFKTGTTNVHNVGVEAAGINVLGADTPIGTGATIYDAGGAVFTGVVTATSFSGGLPITNGADNRIITASSASAIQGESTLTYDGSWVDNVISGTGGYKITTSGDHAPQIIGNANRSAVRNTLLSLHGYWNNTNVAMIDFQAGPDTTNKDDGRLSFYTRYSGESMKERMRINSDGKISLGSNANFTPGARLEIRDTIGGGGGTGLVLNDIGSSGGTEGLHIEWRSGSDKQSDQVRIGQTSNATGSGSNFFVATNHQDSGSSTERLRISSTGQVCIGEGFKSTGGGQLTIRGLGVNAYAVQDYQYIGIPNGDNITLSQIRFTANTSGNSVIQGARIQARSDAAWSATGDAPTRLEFWTAPDGSASTVERFRIDKEGQLTNTLQATSFVTTKAFSNLAKLDIRGTNIADSNHYILSYGEGHANDHEFHMVNTVGHLVFRTGTGSLTERVRINLNGEMSIGGQHADHAYDANSYGNPSLLIAGDDNADILTLMNDDPSPNNGDYASLGFRVAGQSTGSYSKAAIIAERNGGYNAIDLVFAIGTDADATRTTVSHEIMRVNHTRTVRILSNSTDNDFKNQNYPGDTSGIKLQNWPSSNTTGAFVSSTYALKAGNGTAQICAWTAQSTATGTVPDMFYSVRTGDAQQHIVRIGGNDIGRGMEISNNITLTGARNSNIISERFRVLPSENDGYDDSHILSCAQTAGNWEQGAGASNYDTSWGWLWQFASANNGTRQVRSGIAYDHKGSEEFKYWSSYGAHTWYVDGGKSGDETAETCSTKAMQINHDGSVINIAQPRYGIYTIGGVQTSNGGSKSVQYLEDCYGQWIVVAKIQQSSHLQSAMASVAQIDTSTGQATGTEWSSSFGSTYPIAVRYVSSSNWKNWRDNRGVDFIQGVPHGRQWRHFFTNGASSGMTSATGGVGSSKYGWTCDGAWDGKGRWHNPTFNWWKLSDPTGYNSSYIQASFFTSATAANSSSALNLNWAGDVKFGVHATAATGGQDTEVTSVYGYDDNVYGHEDNYPSSPANNSGSDITAMPLWICLNVTGIGQFH